jgi:hypothetical protein
VEVVVQMPDVNKGIETRIKLLLYELGISSAPFAEDIEKHEGARSIIGNAACKSRQHPFSGIHVHPTD